MLSGKGGSCGYLHPEGPFDDPRGGSLREVLYPRLRKRFQFVNEKKLFQEVGNQLKFSLNIYGPSREVIGFDSISNIFTPTTIDACYADDGVGGVEGLKTASGDWNTTGHLDRIVGIDSERLAVFAVLYDPPGTPALKARLPSLHTSTLSAVMVKLAEAAHRFSDISNLYVSSDMWNETLQVQDGTITRAKDRSSNFVSSPDDLVIAGPHFHISNPCYQTPRAICDTRRAFDVLDIEELPDNYLPRSNYAPMVDREEYRRRLPRVTWNNRGSESPQPVTDFYRIAFRNMMVSSNERTMIGSIIPPGVAHPHSVVSVVFRDENNLLQASAVTGSIIGDFYVKTSGRSGLYDGWAFLPIVPLNTDISARVLGLNCLSTHYSELWARNYAQRFNSVCWSREADPRLNSGFFRDLLPAWQTRCAIRSPYARRLALLELDVLVAQSIGVTLEELKLIYRVQFPVMQQYERETWYDMTGRIAFTNSKGLVGVGLPRKKKRTDHEIRLVLPDGSTFEVEGWDQIRKLQDDGKLPDGSVVATTVMDNTQPGGPVRRERKYVAPFALANREEDYRIAWEFFERKKAAEAKA
jgi:hypothetical protein